MWLIATTATLFIANVRVMADEYSGTIVQRQPRYSTVSHSCDVTPYQTVFFIRTSNFARLQTRAPLANVCRSNSLYSAPSIPVTASHVTKSTDLNVAMRYVREVGFMEGLSGGNEVSTLLGRDAVSSV